MKRLLIDTDDRRPNVLATKLGLFATLSADELDVLARLTCERLRRLGPREDVIREGDALTHVNLIVSGWACRYKMLEDGRRQIIAFLFPGDLFDLRICVLKRMDHSIGTLMPTTVAEIPKEAVVKLTEGRSRVARALWWSSLVTGAIEREWIVNLGQRTALERLGHLFCEVFLRQSSIGLANGWSCDMPLTQTELAEACGLSTVHINRSLQELRAQGLVDLQRRRLSIRDFDRLAQRSLFNPASPHLDRADDPDADGPGPRSGTIGNVLPLHIAARQP